MSPLKPVVQSIVPHTPALILPLVDKIVDEFWECRRYGELWNSSRPPPEYYSDAEIAGACTDAVSQRVHKKLILDLVAETLADVYLSEEDDHRNEDCHQRQSDARWRLSYDPPTTINVLKPLIQSRVLHKLGLTMTGGSQSVTRPVFKWGTARRKHDNVDILLIRELRDEEPEWVDYSAEEFTVKMQLVDSLWELLLGETMNILKSTSRRRSVSREVWFNTSLVESY